MTSDTALDVLSLFSGLADAHAGDVVATARSKDDKEYFIQDWVAERASAAGLGVVQSGRNAYPDFWLTGRTTFGNEVKSLARKANGEPARADMDFNSTVPRPTIDGNSCVITFAVYEKSADLERRVTTVCLTDVALLNADDSLVHRNYSIAGFGSYGDGLVRNRRMYRFTTPVRIGRDFGTQENGGRSIEIMDKATLILREGLLAARDAHAQGLVRIGTITRTWAARRLKAYTVTLDAEAPVAEQAEAAATEDLAFEVWAPGRPR